ncbi:pentapeptide repeat-containing protein [bacterium]|nr:pentapeptide repeat-containing protein [bacterium]
MFYFKEAEFFEFAHLSFRDYFTALDIIESLKEIAQTWSVKDARDKLIEKIYKLLGYRILDSDQLDFASDIINDMNEQECLKIAKFLSEQFKLFKKHEYMNNIPQENKFQAEVTALKNMLPLIIIFKKDNEGIYEFEDILDYLHYKNFLGSFEYSLSIFSIEREYLIKIKINNKELVNGFIPRANLNSANLIGAFLDRANLSGAFLSNAILIGANLIGADLSGANLSGANLSGAFLSGAFLSGANLSGANLIGANLIGANLSGAFLIGAKNITVSQIKSTINWDEAQYSNEFKKKLGL